MIKLLVHGHIPKWYGGKQVSGLSNVMYSLSLGLSNTKNIKVFFNATDVRKTKIINKNFIILGWNILTIFKSIFLNFFILKKIWSKSKKIVDKTTLKIKINLFFKRLIFIYRLKIINPQALHLHGLDFFIFKDLIPRSTNIFVTIHHLISNDKSVNDNLKYLKYEKKLISAERIKKIFFVSSQVKFESMIIGNLINNRVILNAIDISIYKFKNITKSRSSAVLNLCTVGSVCERKGQERVIKACLKIKKFTKITYSIIGGGNLDYINKILRLSLGSKILEVRYLGVVSNQDVVDIYHKSDFFILPSIKEGFGLTTVESISCGTKAITTNDNPLVDEGILNKVNSVLLNNYSVNSIVNTLKNLDVNYNKLNVSKSVSSLNWNKQASKYAKDFINCD